MKDGDVIPLGKDGAVLVDESGAVAIEVTPTGGGDQQTAILLELGGKLNKSDDRWKGRFLLAVGQVAELMADLAVAAKNSGDQDFVRELDVALAREQARIAAIDAEHRE